LNNLAIENDKKEIKVKNQKFYEVNNITKYFYYENIELMNNIKELKLKILNYEKLIQSNENEVSKIKDLELIIKEKETELNESSI
jgi:hypothetical protein